MCLHANQEITDQVLNGEWPRKVYKILRYDPDYNILESPYNHFTWTPGINVSSRPADDKDPEETEGSKPVYNRGFHVWLQKKVAEDAASEEEGELVVEFTAQKEDFIVAGDDNGGGIQSALFTKVEVDPVEHDRALKFGNTLEIVNDDDDDWEDDEDEDDWDEEDDWDDDDDDDYDDDDEDWEDEEDEEDEDDDDDYDDDDEDWEDEEEE